MKLVRAAGIGAAALAVAAGCERDEQPIEYPTSESPYTEGALETARSDDEVDPMASQLVKRMSDYLGSLSSFSVTADSSTEVVLKSGQKVELNATSRVYVRRPNKLRSERRGELADVVFVYDGKNVTVFGKKANMYAQAPAPETLDETLDYVRDSLDLEAPGADLLYSDVHDVLMKNANSAMYVGEAIIDGRVCEHIAVDEDNLDWQLWIEKGSTPRPCKYQITTEDTPGNPSFTVVFREWDTTTPISDEAFRFVPPQGAERIEFLSVIEARRRAEENEGETP